MRESRLGWRCALVAGPLLALCTGAVAKQTENWLPPWNPPPTGGEHFSVPPFDAVADPHGDVVDPQLTVMRDAPHPQAAKAFFAFMQGATARAIYHKYGFQEPQP